MTTATTSETIQIYRVYIKATPEAIWEAVTKPEWTVQYGYAPVVEYELRSGGAFRAHANEGMKALGCPDVISDGEVIEADPPRKLVQTWRMTMTPEMAAEAFTRLTYDIEPVRGGVTKLTVTHDVTGAPHVGRRAEGRERVERGRRRLERDPQRAKDAARDGPATPLPKWPGIAAVARSLTQRTSPNAPRANWLHGPRWTRDYEEVLQDRDLLGGYAAVQGSVELHGRRSQPKEG